MHLINVLAAGVAGAENGTVNIYARGTSTRAATYSDVYGATANQTTAAHQLDANGGLTVYADQLVDCVVLDSAGAAVRSFTAGDETTAITYSGTAFTGTNPVTGASAINQPRVLKEILDLFGTSFGATNGNVTFGGSDRLLYSVLAGLNCFYNVKDPLYGAVGNGTTDDTAAIEAATDAAEAAGGGVVFFPAGTYKISTLIEVNDGVSLLGTGRSIIRQSHGSNGFIEVVHDSPRYGGQWIRGLSFDASVSSTGTVLKVRCTVDANADGTVPVAGRITIEDCVFGAPTAGEALSYNAQGTLVHVLDGGDTQPILVDLRNCVFTAASSTQKCLLTATSYSVITARNCDFNLPATYNGTAITLSSAVLEGCVINAVPCTAGTFTMVSCAGGSVFECIFSSTGGATATAISWVSGTLVEDNNTFGSSGVTAYGGITTDAALAAIKLGSRDKRVLTITTNAAAYSVPFDQYGTIYLIRTATGAQVLTPVCAPVGAESYLIIRNNTGSSMTASPQFTGFALMPTAHGDASVAIANNTGRSHSFVSIVGDSSATYMIEMAFNDATGMWP